MNNEVGATSVARVQTGVMPFEQQPRESAKAFAAFKTYLELGPERSLAVAADQLGKSKRMMEKWRRKFDWPARVQAHAAHLAEVERKAIEARAVAKAVEWEKTHESVRREAWAEAEETIAMVREARQEWMAKGRLPGWEHMARRLELADLRRFVAGADVFSRQSDGTTIAMQYAKHGITLRCANTDRVNGWAEVLQGLGEPDTGLESGGVRPT